MKKQPNEEIVSLNDKLFNEFSVEELERRLETDPLMLATMFAEESYASGAECDCAVQTGGGMYIQCTEVTIPTQGGK